MRLLLDTHTLLWFLNGSSRRSVPAREAICDVTNHRFVSTASLWEVAIKTSLGKLTLATSFEEMVEREIDLNDINVLPIEGPHLITMAKLAFPSNDHRDPFDRMIVSQAICEDLILIRASASKTVGVCLIDEESGALRHPAHQNSDSN